MPGIRVDGNDVLACYAVMAEAAAAGPRGRRPDADRSGHLPDGPAHHLRRPDPVPVTATRSTSGRRWTRFRATAPTYRPSTCGPSGWSTASTARAARLCTELRDAIVNTPDMDIGELFDTVYAEITPTLQAQRDQLLAELAKEA